MDSFSGDNSLDLFENNFPDVFLCTEEDKLRVEKALDESQKSGNVTPLIKEELYCVIQSRRLSRGCGELTVDTSPKQSQHSLSEIDVQKRSARMAQNRRAAQRYREKKRVQHITMQEETAKLQSENAKLRQDIQELEREKASLQQILFEHIKFCPSIFPEGNHTENRFG